jgi:hypothetical protein
MKDKCETCRFWDRWVRNPPSKEGDCRKRAPAVVTEGESAGTDGFPAIDATNWCGDHEPKEEGVKWEDVYWS